MDDVGVGGGVVDALKAAGLPVLPVNFGKREGLRPPPGLWGPQAYSPGTSRSAAYHRS